MKRSPWTVRAPVLAAVLALGAANVALANAGTPLMWLPGLQLLFGNVLLGVAEGAALAIFFRRDAMCSALLMIAANYASMALGYFVLDAWSSRLPIDLSNLVACIWLLTLAAYVLTLAAEWPFIAVLFWRRKRRWFLASVRATVVVQTASYAALAGLYAMNSHLVVGEVTSPSRINAPAGLRVYYISDVSGDVCSRLLPDGAECLVARWGFTDKDDLLYVAPSEGQKGRWDLMSRWGRPILRGLEVTAAQPPPFPRNTGAAPPQSVWQAYGYGARLGAAAEGEVETEADIWAAGGLWLYGDARRRIVAVETPWIKWFVRLPVLLPGGCVLFQLGPNQICLYEPSTNRVALVAKGRGPVVVMEHAVETEWAPVVESRAESGAEPIHETIAPGAARPEDRGPAGRVQSGGAEARP